MIRLLAPTTTVTADEGATVIVEMSQDIFRALAAAQEVAFSEAPPEWEDAADELHAFFTGTQQPDETDETGDPA